MTPSRTGLLILGLLVLLGSCSDPSGPDGRLAIGSITPAILVAWDTATIHGTGFSTELAENHVAFDGVAGQVLAATASELTVALPGGDVLPCGPSGLMTVTVTVDTDQASAQHPTGTVQRTLAVGESVAILGAGVGCNTLTEAGTYVVSVFNSSGTPGGRTAFRLVGETQVAATAAALAADATASADRPGHGPPAGVRTMELEHASRGHDWLLGANARLARDLAARAPRPVRTDAHALMTAQAEVGTERDFRIADLDGSQLCTNPVAVTARAVYSGPTAIVWEDVEAPLAGQMDDRWQTVGQEYEGVMHSIIREYFGDPLAYDPWIANPGRVHMVFSPTVNEFERGIAGFVFAGDFLPSAAGEPGACGASNESAVFYGQVPTDPGGWEDPQAYTVDRWAWEMRSTIIHEVKHLVSYAERFRLAAEAERTPVFETVWLEEATARLAEEFYARAMSGYGQGGNVTYDESIWCERRVGANHPQCDPIPFIMGKHFFALYSYYRTPDNLSPIGAAVAGDWTFYGSGWLLVRWAIDHAGMSEQAFSRALVVEPQLTGVANLAARTGRPFAAMLADFSLAMAVDDHPNGLATRPELTFPGWNTRDVLNGMHTDIGGQDFNLAWPLTTVAIGSGTFSVGTGVRGGSAAFFTLAAGPGDGALVRLVSSAGGRAAPALGLAIVRID